MKIGIDLFALQAPSCRGRGIGRYAGSLLRALLVDADGWDFVFYRRHDLPIDADDDFNPQVGTWVDVGPDPAGSPDGTLQQIVQANPDRLDWLLILNPVVERGRFAIPEPVPGGPRLAAVFYDLIPALFPKFYLAGEGVGRQYDLDLRRLQPYHLLAAISDATGRDLHDRLQIPRHRIVNLRGAADRAFFRPASGDEFEDDSRILADHGVREPFFYYLGNVDHRKNVLGLVDAYALLPEPVRASHQLVLTFGENAWFRAVLKEKLDEHGLGDRVVSTGPAGDAAVRAFYRRARLFLSPSLYEGFGLPALEAMQCGAAVVVADNSSQPEVIGDAGVLAPSGEPAAWAAILAPLAGDPARIESLREAALIQSRQFSWEDSARRLRSGLEAATKPPAPRRSETFALIPVPSPGRLGFGPEATKRFEDLCRNDKPIVFYDIDRATDLPPLPIGRRWFETSLIGRVGPLLGSPPLLYLVDEIGDLPALLAHLSAHPGAVAFGNPGMAASDDALRAVIRATTGVSCASLPLFRRVAALAGDEFRGRVQLLDSAASSPSSGM